MKFNMMIDGVETLFPEFKICHFQEDNEIVVYFLNTSQKDIERIKKYIKKPILKFEDQYIILFLKEFQYAFDMRGYEKIMDFYNTGGKIGFAFEDESGNLLDIPTPSFYK